MLSKPVLAKCDDRSQLAKQNRRFGEPDQWMASANLASLRLSSTSFDFFVDWSAVPPAVGDKLWVKRISDAPVQSLGPDDVFRGALVCQDDLAALEQFAIRYGFVPLYMIFEEGVDWKNAPAPILAALLSGGAFPTGKCVTLEMVKTVIRNLSGGPVYVGNKGLIYGTSSLECHLSRTDALWPGDADCVLWSPDEQRAVALLEFKKHNLDTPLAEEGIQKYMAKDRRKWERLGLLRDRIEAPLFCIYYSTDPRVETIKVERLVGPYNNLQDGGSNMVEINGMSQAEIGTAIARLTSA